LTAAKEAGRVAAFDHLDLLKEPEERALMKELLAYGYNLMIAAKQLDPCPLTQYFQSLASIFHKFYDRHKVLSDDAAMTSARLALVAATRQVLANGLAAIGVSAPERM
jgi:arginyl-tRNA synthetase